MAVTLLEPNTSSPEVMDFQKRLAKLGFKVPVDGSFDRKTLAAVQLLAQRMDYGRSVDKVDAAFLKELARFEKTKFVRLNINGTVLIVDEVDLAKARKEFGPRLEAALRPLVNLANDAMFYWKANSKLKEENWFIGTTIELYSGARLPKEADMKAAVKAAEMLTAKARKLELKQSDVDGAVRTIRAAFDAMSTYRDKLHGGGDNLVSNLETVRDGCVVIVQVGVAIGSGGSSVGVQAALGAGVAGYGQLLKEIDSAGRSANYSLKRGAWNMGVAMTVDAAASLILKGSSGKKVLDAIEKQAMARVPKLLQAYVGNAMKKGAEKLVEDGIKGIPKLLEGKMSFEEVVKAGLDSFLSGLQIGVLGPVVEKYSRTASKNFTFKDFEAASRGVKFDKAATEAVNKVIDAVAGSVTQKVLSGWDPKKDAKKAEGEIKAAILADPKVQAELRKQGTRK